MNFRESVREEELIEVQLRNGRVEVSDTVDFANLASYAGSCETNTSNQTKATCC